MLTKNNIVLYSIFLLGSLFHIWSFSLNEVMKIADSFAYLQMAYFLKEFSVEGLGSGWFGFVYSVPIAFLDFFAENDFLSWKIVNIILMNISAFLLYKISRKILSEWFSLLVVILFFLSPTFLHFNIHILSENIYIPIFLWLFLATWNFIEHPHSYRSVILIGCLLGLMYLTRAEAFIYMLSIGLISLMLLLQKRLSLKQFFLYGSLFFLSFFLFISPYLIHLHNITGEWGLTNKGASNYRQAQLRGQDRMDDAGFEQAVWELTPDKHHLIAGFAGGMKYDRPQIEGSFLKDLRENPQQNMERILTNWKKLFTLNLPEIFLGKSPSLFRSEDSRFRGNYIFLLFSLLPLLWLLWGIFQIWKKQKDFFFLSLFFFLPAFFFFTLFFTLNRYFLIFLPLMLVTFVFGLQELWKTKTLSFLHRQEYLSIDMFWNSEFSEKVEILSSQGKNIFAKYKKFLSLILITNYLIVLALSNLVYYNSEKTKDSYYALKAEAGMWLKENGITEESSNIMERFPIVTYYSGSKNRWITPYTNTIQDIVGYARFNDIEFLVVDTMDFLTYRPALADLLENTPENMELVQEWKKKEQKVRVYEIKNNLSYFHTSLP